MSTAESSSFNRVVEFSLRSRVEEISASARTTVALLLLDTLGIAAGAVHMDAARIARDSAAELYGTGPNGEGARMLFDGRRVSLAGAAFAGATQIDNLDGHDGYNPTKGHIGVAVVPALIALTEGLPDLSGPEALATLVIGYEVAGRAGISLHATVSDYHTSGAWNALGVAAMAARLRALSSDQLRHALGIAEYHGPRSQMMREIDNPTMLHDGSGWGPMVGLSAAVMAEKGFLGAPAITVEDVAVAEHWKDLGDFWTVERQYIKPYPICRWAHAAIDAVRELCLESDVRAADVGRVEIETFHEAARLYPAMPESTSKAQYSLRFAVAVMIVDGHIGPEHISGDGLKDIDVESLLPRIDVIEGDRYNADFPTHRRAKVSMTLCDGRVLVSGVVDARGGPEGPYSENDIVEKFLNFAVPTLGQERASEIVSGIGKLHHPDSRFSDFTSLVLEPVSGERT